MTFRKIDIREAIFQPALVGTTETTALFTVKAGERVVSASGEIITNAASSTSSKMDLGDGDGTTSFIAGSTAGAGTFDLESGTAGVAYPGAGAYLANSGGKLYIVDDTVDVVYSIGTPGATNPKVRFRIGVIKEK